MLKSQLKKNDIDYKAIQLYNSAIECYKKGEFLKAEKLYLKALEISPNFPQALNNLGNLYRKIGKMDKARYFYVKAFQTNRDFSFPVINIAYLNMTKGEFKRAYYTFKFIFNSNLTLENDDIIYNINIDFGLCCLRLSKYCEAVDAFEKAIELRPCSIEAHLGRALVLKELEKYREAFKELERTEALGFKSTEVNLLKKFLVSKILEK